MRAAPTPRLVLAAVLAGLPAVFDGWLWLSTGLNVVLIVLAAIDLFVSGRRRFEAVRQTGSVLSLGAENPIRIQVRSVGRPVDLELKDDLPFYWELVGGWPKIHLSGTSEWTAAEYRIKPVRRGLFGMNMLHGRYLSPLGLWRRRLVWPLPEAVRVYPNLIPARQWEIAIRQGKHLEGLKRSRLRGTGTDFESLREYQPGDQYRAINWSATARQGKLVTTLYQIDRSQPVMLLIDAGRMMIPQVNDLAKLDHALNAALLLATVAAERGDQVGLMLFGGEVKAFMPPRKGRAQVLSMVETLYAVSPEQVEPDYGRMVGWFRAKHKKRSLVVLFTDMVDPDVNRGLIANLAPLAAHHLVLVVCLTDPALLRLAALEPSTSEELYEKASALEVLAQRTETKARLHSAGVTVIDVPPEEFSTAVVNQYLLVKEQGRL